MTESAHIKHSSNLSEVPGVAAHACNPGTQDSRAGGLQGVEDKSEIQADFEASLGY